MHGGRMAVRNMGGSTQPFKVANVSSIHRRMDVGGLRCELRFGMRSRDWLRQHVRGNAAKRKIHIGKMLPVQLIKIAIVGRMMLGAIPPVPVTAFGDEQFL